MDYIEEVNEWLTYEAEANELPEPYKYIKLYCIYKKAAYLYELILKGKNEVSSVYEQKAYSCLLNISNIEYRTALGSTRIDQLPLNIMKHKWQFREIKK